MAETDEQTEREEPESEIQPTPEALDPSGAYANTPGRTGRPPGESPEHPADETIPPP